MLASLSATTSFAAFLPPFGTPRVADFAVEVSPGDNVDFQIVDERPGLVLGRGAPPQRSRIFHIDAGPYDTPSDAADALLRWISEYWECERVGDEQNSCFPYGGCHRRCWWRGSRGRVSLELELCAEAARLHELDALRERASELVTDDDEAIALVGSLVALPPSRYYCGLRPAPAGRAGTVRCCAEDEADAPALRLWRRLRDSLPPLITGAAGADGDDAPEEALFNMLCIRVPFLTGCAALVANVVLGGGVAVGDRLVPPAEPVVGAAALWRLLDAAIGIEPPR